MISVVSQSPCLCIEPLEPITTSEQVTVARHSPTALTFNLPSEISLDDSDEPIRCTVTLDDEPIDNFDLKDVRNNVGDELKPVLQKIFDEIDLTDAGNYVITVDVGRQQYVHKLSVSVGE